MLASGQAREVPVLSESGRLMYRARRYRLVAPGAMDGHDERDLTQRWDHKAYTMKLINKSILVSINLKRARNPARSSLQLPLHHVVCISL